MFTSTELIKYEKFISYVILSAMLSLNRAEMKTKVMESPEVVEVIHDLSILKKFMDSLYRGEYNQFFSVLAAVEGSLKQDRVMFPHYRYYVQQMRIRAYW